MAEDGVTELAARAVSVSFGALRAVDGMSLRVGPGECVGLIGPNGAGKSTLLNVLSGFQRPSVGEVTLAVGGTDHRLTGAPVTTRARLGVARVFQTPRLVPELSAVENVELGMAAAAGFGGVLEALGLPGGRRGARRRRAHALGALERVGLREIAPVRSSELSIGQQRLVELARAVASDARVLLLDEPFAGLSRPARAVVADLVGVLRDAGAGVLLVEHDLAQVRRLADRLVVMDRGTLVAAGPVAETLADPEVVRRYIGDIELDVGGGLGGTAVTSTAVTSTAVASTAGGDDGGPVALEARDLSVFYGSIPATEGVALRVAAGGGLALIGPNGAGKSTVLRGIAGLLPATGEVRLGGARLDGLDTPRRFARGLGFVPQSLTAVVDLTVGENLRLSWLTGSRSASHAESLERVRELFPEIVGRLRDPAGSLSGGQRQMLAIGRALMAGPSVLLLDEPSAGLAPALVAPLADALVRLRAAGIAIVLVEHNLGLVRAACSDIQALRAGRPSWHGPTERFDDAVAQRVFLGGDDPSPEITEGRAVQ